MVGSNLGKGILSAQGKAQGSFPAQVPSEPSWKEQAGEEESFK